MALTLFLRLLDAVLITLVGFILARVAGRLVRGAIHELDVARLARKVGVRVPLAQPVGIAVEATMAVVVIALALFRLGVLREVVFGIVALLAAALLLALVPAVRYGVPNLLAACMVPRERLREGASIRAGPVRGRVVKRRLFSVELRTPAGDRLDVPLAYLRKAGCC
jgi:hypothetical protein